MAMSGPPASFYADWRRLAIQDRPAGALCDQTATPPERLLQAVWHRQRLRREALKTTDGRIVRVFHPGFAGSGGGPDFRDAVVQIGEQAPRTGDVEIDLRAQHWRAHGHDRNPHFRNVLLHVVWEDEPGDAPAKAPNVPPVLPLQPVLDAPLAELSVALQDESLRVLPEALRGRCCAPLGELEEWQRAELLESAARVRLENKSRQILARARQGGWEQALWENLFRALGYRHNAWPMQSLAETKSLWSRGATGAFEFQARLLGVSSLLPAEWIGAQKAAAHYLRRAWDLWWRERDRCAEALLPRGVWKFHGLRPANHPQRRLALAAHWLADGNFLSQIERWIAAGCSSRPQDFLSSLLEILQPPQDEFWSWHWTLRSPRLKKPQPLLGAARATDLAMNSILPWLWIRAGEGRNRKIQAEVERRYFAWPAGEDNAVLKLARERLLGTARRPALKTAAAQQGLLQIVRDFCQHSNALCDHCRFPELVRGWSWPKNSPHSIGEEPPSFRTKMD
jgi:hypothetical protein